MRGTSLFVLFGFLVLTLGGGYLSSLVVAPNIPDWYEGLAKPAFNPPNRLFAPVWTTLYVLMAVAAWRVWRKAGFSNLAMRFWAIQLGLNLLWSWLFFGRHDPMLAFYDLLLMWAMLARTIRWTWPIDRQAAWLLAPTLVWVTFAGVLNWEIWRLNG